MKTLDEVITEYLDKHPPAKELFEGLKSLGNIYLIGGVLREYKDNNGIDFLRDVDMVADIPEPEYEEFLGAYKPEVNAFGGYKICCLDLVVDIWRLEQTWAYAKRKIICADNDYVINLPRTVFLNMDAIVYDLKNDVWYDKVYYDALNKGILDVVLKDNPQIGLNIVRSLVIRKRYNMRVSRELCDIISDYCIKNQNAVHELYEIQLNRYKKEIISLEELQKELSGISTGN